MRVAGGPLRVAIADDSGLFRSSLTHLLEASGIRVTAGVATGGELAATVRKDPPDAVILDIGMPPTFTDEGIRTAAELRRAHPGLGILVLSHYDVTSYASELLSTVGNGIGYLLKDKVADVGVLLDALDRVAAGEQVVDDGIVMRLLRKKTRPTGIDTLSEREHHVLRLMAEGRSNQGIANEMRLAPKTVENQVTAIFTKLGLDHSQAGNTRVRAVLEYLRSAGPAR